MLFFFNKVTISSFTIIKNVFVHVLIILLFISKIYVLEINNTLVL